MLTKVARGFTLVEVLTVTVIISILVSIVYVSFSNARETARDNKRKADLKQLQLAIELYKAQHGVYPDPCPEQGDGWAGGGEYYDCDSGNDYIMGLAPTFIEELPYDDHLPTTRAGYLYQTNADRSAYKILAHQTVESQIVETHDDEFARCPAYCVTGNSDCAVPAATYGLYSAGAECY